MNNPYVFINDNYIPSNEATILISDLAVQRGYGVFDFFKTIDNVPVFIEDHLDRFYYSVAEMHLQVQQSRAALKEIIAELMRLNQMPDSGIRITVTGGYSSDGYNLAPSANLIITQQPLTIQPSAFHKGIKLITYNYQRQLSHIKTLDYLNAIWLQPLIKERGADDVLYHNNGMLAECPRANFFLVTKEGDVLTPKNNILKGVTRKNLLRLPQQAIRIEERDLTLDDLMQASEAFITSTTKNVLPVTHIDGRPINHGQPGPVTHQLHQMLMSEVQTQLS